MKVLGSLGFGLSGLRQFGQNTKNTKIGRSRSHTKTLKLAKVGLPKSVKPTIGQSRFGQGGGSVDNLSVVMSNFDRGSRFRIGTLGEMFFELEFVDARYGLRGVRVGDVSHPGPPRSELRRLRTSRQNIPTAIETVEPTVVDDASVAGPNPLPTPSTVQQPRVKFVRLGGGWDIQWRQHRG